MGEAPKDGACYTKITFINLKMASYATSHAVKQSSSVFSFNQNSSFSYFVCTSEISCLICSSFYER